MIHKTAIIDPKAILANKVSIGPYSVIGPDVEIGENTEIQSHVNIIGKTKIGTNNRIYPFASIGTDPQDMKYKGEKTSLIIGNNNKIREYATINTGTFQGGGITRVGDNNLIMIGAHIAHDCIIGNDVVIANNAAIAGHALKGYVFVKPIKSDYKYDSELEKPLVGKVAMNSCNFKKGDIVGFSPGDEYEFIIDNNKMYRVIEKFITIKYENKRNEETYNPSWA